MIGKISGLFTVNVRDVVGAFLSAFIGAVLVFLFQALSNPSFTFGTLNWNELLRVALIAGITSLLKRFSTDEQGKFLGAVKV